MSPAHPPDSSAGVITEQAKQRSDGNGASREGPGSLRVVNAGTDPESDPRREIPELGFRDYWYPLVAASKVPKRKPMMIQLLGDEVCVFRGESGIAAIANFCGHRSARLSGGRCHFAGTVSCPYHGWTYDEHGECVAALSEDPESKVVGRVAVKTYPTVTLKGVVFAWMGDGEPADPYDDLPRELFDDSMVFSDATIWHANWRPALENLSDNHAPYTHRNSIILLMQPYRKASYGGARPVFDGGNARLNYYADGKDKDRPVREYFPGVRGYWPKTQFREYLAPFFALRPFRWIWLIGNGDYWKPQSERVPYHPDASEWSNGPHMPGMQRLGDGAEVFTRWCVPIDRDTTREFYLYACRPGKKRRSRVWAWLKYPIIQKWLRNRNLGFQDARALEHIPYDMPERFSSWDVETVGWRRLAILSARYGGRHDLIPPDVIARLNGRTEAGTVDGGTGVPVDGAGDRAPDDLAEPQEAR